MGRRSSSRSSTRRATSPQPAPSTPGWTTRWVSTSRLGPASGRGCSGASAGVVTTALPADYADYHHIAGAAFRNNQIVHFEFETALLAAQTANRTLGLPAAGNQNPRLIWNPTDRTLTGGGSGGSQERILYLELSD